MVLLRGKSLIITALSGLLVLGASTTLRTKPAKAAAAKRTVVNVTFKPSTSEADLSNYVYETVDPTSANYHHYLTPSEFADKFGQSSSYIQAFKDYLNKYHIRTYAYPGNLAMKLTATPANMQKAFHAKYVKPAKKGYQSTSSYKLPEQLSDKVVAVIGLYTDKPASKNSKKATKKTAKKTPKKTTKKAVKKTSSHKKRAHSSLTMADLPISGQQPNINLSANAFSKKYGAAKFAKAYQLNPLYEKGMQGQGQRIGIITVSDIHDSDLTTYWKQAGVNDDVSRIHHHYLINPKNEVQKVVDYMLDGPQTETTVDVESASSVAPKADVDLYIGDDTNPNTSDPSALYTGFMSAISDNQDKQLSASFSAAPEVTADWGDPSATVKKTSDAFNLMYEQAAAQGITVFQASGDYGPVSSPSAKENHGMSTSAYQVLVGGTTLPYQKILNNKVITISKERTWGDTYAQTANEKQEGVFGGSGGGFSALNPTPRYQQGVSGVNTFRAENFLTFKKGKFTLTKHPHLIFGTGNSRNIPDVSGNADPQTGYATFVSGKNPVLKNKKVYRVPSTKWMIGGGTSYTSPQMAGANAVMNSGRQTPIGFWNPQIYKYAQESDSPFNVLDDADNNNNLYYTGQPGKLYNQASGLGTIDFTQLYNKFASDTH